MEKIKAILIDDELNSLQNLEKKLQEFCPDVDIVAVTQKPEDGILLIRQYQPEVVFLDIEMPRMDGFEVAMQVRFNQRLRNIPIIMITSRTGEKHRARAYEIGVNGYMGKPFQEKELLSNIKNLLDIKTIVTHDG